MIRELPEGYVVDAGWLGSLGLSASSVRDYVTRGWLQRVAPRLYRRPDPSQAELVRWEVALLSLQALLGQPAHVGGMTALELAGYWHYAPAGRRRIWVYSDAPPVRTLLARMPLDADIVLQSRKLFAVPELGVESRPLDLVTSTLGPSADTQPIARKRHLRVSSLERAILEVLDDVPGRVSFEHGAELFDGLTTLRPALMQSLLEACRSVKAKRLFLYFATKERHGWTRKLRIAAIDIGSGKRQIVPGGELDPDYLITVPRTGARRAGRVRG